LFIVTHGANLNSFDFKAAAYLYAFYLSSSYSTAGNRLWHRFHPYLSVCLSVTLPALLWCYFLIISHEKWHGSEKPQRVRTSLLEEVNTGLSLPIVHENCPKGVFQQNQQCHESTISQSRRTRLRHYDKACQGTSWVGQNGRHLGNTQTDVSWPLPDQFAPNMVRR